MSSASATAAIVPLKTMLVVDPDRKVNHVLDRLVTDEGWDLQHAPDNQAALSALEARPFKLIITGQKTSGREDLELLRKIRRIRPHVRMIILTDESTPGDIIASLRENAFSYFCAPFYPALLSNMVHLALTLPSWDDGIEVISATPNWIRLLATCTRGTADRLVQFLRESDLPDAEKEDVAVAFHELLLNAMEHGGNFAPDQYVEIGYLRASRAVACRIKDPGKGFSFEELHHAAISSASGDLFSHMAVHEKQGRRPGGYGLLLVDKLVDDVIYGEHGNDVIFIKYLNPSVRTTPDSNWKNPPN
jgi:anti-sigma regulatory factor (Ser/Thr protein kinase)/ActR/RegA family two-component response regulator